MGEVSLGAARFGSIGVEVSVAEGGFRRERECRRLLDVLQERGATPIRRRYVPGEAIYRAEERDGVLYILTWGVARLFTGYTDRTHGKEATLRLVGPWELLGYPIFCRLTRRTSAEAVTDCEIVKAPRVFLERSVQDRAEVHSALANLLELALVEQEEMFACLLPRKTEARLARLLPILLGKFGESGRYGQRVVNLHLTRSDLAAMVASTRESVTGAVIRLRNRGIITMRSGRITVLDPEALAEIAEE